MDLGGTGTGGGGQRGWMRWLFVAVLVGIIVGAAAMCVHSFSGRRKDSAPPRVDMHFECGLCGHEFVTTREQFHREVGDLEDEDDQAAVLIDCPSCGASDCSASTVQCPKCGKHFLSIELIESAGAPRTVRPGEANNVCTHCGTDIAQWHNEHEKRK